MDDTPSENRQAAHPGHKFVEMENAVKNDCADKSKKNGGWYGMNNTPVDSYFCEQRKKEVFYQDKASCPYKEKFHDGVVIVLPEYNKK